MIAWLPVAAVLAQAALPVAPPAPPAPPPRPDGFQITSAGDGVGSTTLDGVPVTVRFEVADGDRGEIVFRTAADSRHAVIPIVDPGTALLVLADRRLAFLTPALLAWAGPDLAALRDRRIAQATAAVAAGDDRESPGSTAESAVRPDLAARVRLSAALSDAGRTDDAIAVMVAAGPRSPTRGGWQRLEFALIAGRIAGVEHRAGRTDAAIARLRTARAAMRADDPYALNIDSNLAAMLVEAGQATEALALVERIRAALPDDAIAGSDRHFAWIRACALQRLGRTAEAAAERPRFLDVAQPYDAHFVAADNLEVSRRGLTCLGDIDGMVELLIAQAAKMPFGAPAHLWVQPGYRAGARDAAFVAAVGRDPRLRATVAGQAAPLPPALAQALRGWR